MKGSEMTSIQFVHNDGGRAAAGFKGKAGDCATRAAAIATGRPYREVYDALNSLAAFERLGKRRKTKSSSRKGVHRDTFREYMGNIGWRWVPLMQIGSGCTVRLNQLEVPTGRIVVSLSRHFAAVIDGVLHDAYDCSRDGTRCIYGYYVEG
jgi:hypothetical protein